jgi:hypothetical protein
MQIMNSHKLNRLPNCNHKSMAKLTNSLTSVQLTAPISGVPKSQEAHKSLFQLTVVSSLHTFNPASTMVKNSTGVSAHQKARICLVVS